MTHGPAHPSNHIGTTSVNSLTCCSYRLKWRYVYGFETTNISKQNKSLRQSISYHSPKWSHWITHFGGIQRIQTCIVVLIRSSLIFHALFGLLIRPVSYHLIINQAAMGLVIVFTTRPSGPWETSEVRNLHRRAAGFPEANLVRMGWLKCRVDGWWVRIWLTCWSFLVFGSHKSGRLVWVIAHIPYMGVVYSPIHEWWIFMID